MQLHEHVYQNNIYLLVMIIKKLESLNFVVPAKLAKIKSKKEAMIMN